MEDQQLQLQLYELTGEVQSIATCKFARNLFVTNQNDLGGLKVQTIHSFCQSLLKKFPIEASISPNFEIMDEFLANDLMTQAKFNLLNKLTNPEFAEVAIAMREIATTLYVNDIHELLSEVINARDRIETMLTHHGSISHLIQFIYKCLGVEVSETVLESTQRFAEGTKRDDLAVAVEALRSGGKTDIVRAEVIATWLRQNCKLDDYLGAFLTVEDLPLKLLATKAVVTKYPAVQAILEQEQLRAFHFKQHYKAIIVVQLTTQLLCLYQALILEYNQLKEQAAYLDYQDLISLSVKLLTTSEASDWIRYKLDGGIDHILVDEAQDTNHEQWAIIESLTAEFFSGENEIHRTLFVVGDEKQSIFSFQGASPTTFHYMKNYFAKATAHLPIPMQMIALDISYRSVPMVLKIVDHIFADQKLKSSITLATTDVIHKAHRHLEQGSVELWPLVQELTDGSEDKSPWPLPIKMIQEDKAEMILADLIVAQIEHWITSKRVLLSKNRPVTYGDIMILVRRRNSFTEYLAKALKRKSIPTTGIDRLRLIESIAILDLMAVGNFILLPEDDLNLAELLKSPIIGLSEDELFILAQDREELSLFAALQLRCTLHPSLQQACDLLVKIMSISDHTPFAFYSYLLNVLNIRKKLCQALTSEVNDQIDELLNLALKYEENYPPSLQGFLHQLQSSQIIIKRDVDTSEDQVKIMTIHGSKGLQAPIVILPDTVALPVSDEKLLWSDDNLLLWPGKASNENLLCQELKQIRKKKAWDEYIRLLYVALTRAEDETIICGWLQKQKPSDDCWYRIVERAVLKIGEEQAFVLPPGFAHDVSCFEMGEMARMLRLNNTLF
jgi:ATP-dependent helicase/nuclease subunit A